jgi:hypothetical protein
VRTIDPAALTLVSSTVYTFPKGEEKAGEQAGNAEETSGEQDWGEIAVSDANVEVSSR